MTASAIVVRGVSKSFGDVDALNGLELDIPEGAFFVLLGPSGAGKTTTLRVIAGLETPDMGSIHLTGIDATKATPAERDLAMVFQSYALYPKQTAAQNIASPLRARGMSKADIEASVKRVSELLHIERLLERKPAQMSGGEMQRVALGRALVRDPRAFLMDEPLTNLDLKLRVEMRTELTRIHRSLGRTFLYVTNDQVEAMSMADQVAVLRQGTVQQVGTPTEIYDHPANRWVATFVGSPRMNLLKCRANGRLEGDGWSLPNPGFDTQSRPPDRPALFGVRSEDLSLDVREESATLEGTVYAVEPLGDRTLVDIEVGEHRVVVKAAPTTSYKIGEQVRASVALDRVHLFDAETESAIARA
jgi:multiple sugar transport system ATP-binding protein